MTHALSTLARPWLTAGDRFVLRLAFGATAGFAVALAMDWQFSFLTAMLAMQILAAAPAAPGLRQGLAIPVVIFIASTAAYGVATLFADAPPVLLAILALVILATFYSQRRGAPAIVMLFIQVSFCGVPLMASTSLEVAELFAELLQKSSVAAVAIVWTAFALFPAPPPAPQAAATPGPAPAGLPPAEAAHVAISDTLVLLPLVAMFIIGGDINNFVVIMITINLLRQVEPGAGGRVAVGLLVGNVMGGVLAVLAQQWVIVADSLVQFLLTVLLAGLWFGGRLVRGGPMAPLFGLAFGTFLLLIGIAITPLPGGSEEAFVIRILKIGAASLYALGALSLVARLRRSPPATA